MTKEELKDFLVTNGYKTCAFGNMYYKDNTFINLLDCVLINTQGNGGLLIEVPYDGISVRKYSNCASLRIEPKETVLYCE